MKKYLLLIPLFIVACKKENVAETAYNKDSVAVAEQSDSTPQADSTAIRKKDSVINNAPVTKEVLRTGVMREVEENQIVRTVDGSRLPFTIGEEFTKDDQKLVLKITNYEKPNIKATISTKDKDFNVRFNQIKLPNGEYDGPFSKEITYEIPQKGEIWLIIGKSNMASGKTKGNFSVSVE